MNKLPHGWTEDRLKDVARINARALSADTDPDFEFNYLEISNVDYSGVINPQAIERIRFGDAPSRARRCTVPGCTVISSVRPNLQAVANLTEGRGDLICSTGFNVVEGLEHKLAGRFVYYVLLSDGARQYFEASGKGVGYPAVDDKDFGSLPVLFPSTQEQECIASFLDESCAAIDDAVATKRQQIQSLGALRETLIESAVMRGVRRNVPMRTVHEDWITEIPAHWDVCRVKRIVSRIDYGISESTQPIGRFPVLKMGHIQRGEIQLRDLDFVDEVADDFS